MLVRRVQQVTHDVVSVVLQPTSPRALRFLPGQYVVLGVGFGGDGSSAATRSAPHPPATPAHGHDQADARRGALSRPALAVPGARVDVRGPYGEFTVAAHPASRQLLLSAGSGITPTLATLRTMADLADDTDVVVVHCARTPADLVCRAELEAIAQSLPAVRLHWLVERADPGWAGPVGRIDAALMRSLVPDAAARETYTCGPPAYMSAARAALHELGADPSRCHEESFVLAETPSLPAAKPATSADAGEVTVRFTRSGADVRSDRRTTVLAAAARAGVRLPSSGEEGLCAPASPRCCPARSTWPTRAASGPGRSPSSSSCPAARRPWGIWRSTPDSSPLFVRVAGHTGVATAPLGTPTVWRRTSGPSRRVPRRSGTCWPTAGSTRCGSWVPRG